MSNKPKDLRKQLRNVAQELLPEILSQELHDEQYKKLAKEMHERITKIEEMVKETLHSITQRQKDVMDYVLRQSSSPITKQ